ncbi:phage baseplate assembly protein V [Aliiglaciecola aliphaticivorans]
MTNQYAPDGGRQRYFGVYPAIVVNIVDPQNLGRVLVTFPWLSDSSVEGWSTLTTPYADDEQGLQIMPEVDSQVVVAFEAGNLRRPYIIGSCWNGAAVPPQQPEDANNIRTLKTRSGSELTFDDSEGASKITLKTSGGHELVLDEASSAITLTHSSGHKIEFSASGAIEITANSTVELNAAAFNVHAPVANFDGIINCTTMIASAAVVSPSYTPGVGNLW